MEDVLGLSNYLEVIFRRKTHFLTAFLTVVSFSFVFTFMLPKIYNSQATIMIEKQGTDSVKEAFEPAKINSEKFETMKKIITSRGKIEEIIKKLSLDKEVRGPLEYESLVSKVTKGLSIELGGSNIFYISFTGTNPRDCMLIVNAVSDAFAEQDVNSIFGDNYTSSPMLNKMLIYYENRVDNARGALTKFQIENQGQMPDSLDKSFAELENYQTKLATLEVAIREKNAKKQEIEKRLAGEISDPLPGEPERLTSEEKELKNLTQQLESLLTIYTDKHPAIIKLKLQIENKKKELLESLKADAASSTSEEIVNIQSPILNPTYLKLRKLLDGTKRELADLQVARQELLSKISNQDSKLKSTPLKEQEYAALQREYNVNQSIYKSLLDKLEKIRLKKEMNLMEQDIRFSVINTAKLPLSPISPKMSKNLLVGTVLGLFLGICSAFIAEFNDHSLRGPKDIQDYLKVPLLAAIPTVFTEVEAIRRKRMITLSLVAGGIYLAFLFLLITREMILTYSPSLLYIQTYKNLFQRIWEGIGLGAAAFIFQRIR